MATRSTAACSIYIHKEEMLDVVASTYPARRYVMVDDKQRILAAMKAVWGERLVTVFPRQGHYAHDPANVGRYPAADSPSSASAICSPSTSTRLLARSARRRQP